MIEPGMLCEVVIPDWLGELPGICGRCEKETAYPMKVLNGRLVTAIRPTEEEGIVWWDVTFDEPLPPPCACEDVQEAMPAFCLRPLPPPEVTLHRAIDAGVSA